MKRMSLCMRNDGFTHVSCASKLLLVTWEYEVSMGELRGLAVFGVPLVAQHGLLYQGIHFYPRCDIPNWLMDAIDDLYLHRKRDAVRSAERRMFAIRGGRPESESVQ